MLLSIAAALWFLLPADYPSTHTLQEAIRWVAPRHVPARRYARIIRSEAKRKDIDPFMVVAFIHVETARKWNPRLKSPTNDFGLTQVHVAVKGSARFLGREEELYNPRTNIREWCRLAAMWRDYHNRACYEKHPWHSHLKWGYRVKDTEHADKVLGVYQSLVQRFPPPIVGGGDA